MAADLPLLRPQDTLSQYGRLGFGGFHNRPRRKDIGALSLTAGRMSVRQMVRRVRNKRNAVVGEGVRYTNVARLAEAGFSVSRDPTPNNPQHCRVECEGEWDNDVCRRFDGCFDEPIVKGSRDG